MPIDHAEAKRAAAQLADMEYKTYEAILLQSQKVAIAYLDLANKHDGPNCLPEQRTVDLSGCDDEITEHFLNYAVSCLERWKGKLARAGHGDEPSRCEYVAHRLQWLLDRLDATKEQG